VVLTRRHAQLAPTGSMVNGVVLMSMKLDLDCRNAAECQ